MCTSVCDKPPENPAKVGLIANHAYALLDIYNHEATGTRLVQLKNPWGNGHKVWSGDFCDKSKCWTPQLRSHCNPTQNERGIFWMSSDDFARWFGDIDVCKLRPRWSEERFQIPVPKGDSPSETWFIQVRCYD